MSNARHGRANGPEAAPNAAQYIAALANELAQLAKRHNFDNLAYILDMARLEADQVAGSWSDRGDGE